MKSTGSHLRRFHGEAERLRSAERIALLEPERVVSLSIEGLRASSVLDIGTGTGLFAEAFARWGLEATGVDVNAEYLSVARTLVPAIRFLEGPAEALPFERRTFDLAFLGHLLHETDDPRMALAEARRVAEASGREARSVAEARRGHDASRGADGPVSHSVPLHNLLHDSSGLLALRRRTAEKRLVEVRVEGFPRGVEGLDAVG